MQILYEDNHLIVVNKPFRMPSQEDQTGDESVFDWVKAYIRDTYKKPGNVYLGLLHRLDRVTGGVMILAKTSKAAARLSKQFQAKQIQKTYYAITEGIPDPGEGELKHYLGKMIGKNIVRAYQKEVKGSKFAHLRYRTLTTRKQRALVEITPLTGRQHQIRVQLATIRCPIVGDVKYGPIDSNPEFYIALYAGALTITHPTLKTSMTFTAKLPDHWVWKEFM